MFHFYTPENIRKPKVFDSNIIKMELKIDRYS